MVPTYNEKENIPLMLKELDKVAGKLDKYNTLVVVIDDSSPDGTADAAKDVKMKNAVLKISVGKKEGLGKALIRGYKYAIGDLEADFVVSIDADFMFDPHDIVKLMKEIEGGYDVVLGSRHDEYGMKVDGWPMSRYLTHWIANDFFGGLVAGNTVVKDHNANFRAVRVKGILDQINWDQLPTRGYGFLHYMIYEFEIVGAKFKEVKVEMKWREKGESKVSFNPKYIKTFVRDTKEYIWMCLKIRGMRIQKRASY